jgi:hypothetical protein
MKELGIWNFRPGIIPWVRNNIGGTNPAVDTLLDRACSSLALLRHHFLLGVSCRQLCQTAICCLSLQYRFARQPLCGHTQANPVEDGARQ